MSKLDIKAYRIDTLCNHGYWQDRALSQIKFAAGLSALRGGKYDGLVESAEDFLLGQWEAEKTVTPDAARQAEEMLRPLSEDAKSFRLHCVSHAHIDMNWMWRFDETVAVTLDTFRTMLDLLAEYPQFTFSQSQASVYRIVEEYGPAGMLDSIRRYVKEGRLEVTASTWVEADKNTPSGESMARHLLYTKRYLQRLLGLSPGRPPPGFRARTPSATAPTSPKFWPKRASNITTTAAARWIPISAGGRRPPAGGCSPCAIPSATTAW